jgi:hypothetical protein
MLARIVHYVNAEERIKRVCYSNTNICPTTIISVKYRHTNKIWKNEVQTHLFELMFGIKT